MNTRNWIVLLFFSWYLLQYETKGGRKTRRGFWWWWWGDTVPVVAVYNLEINTKYLSVRTFAQFTRMWSGVNIFNMIGFFVTSGESVTLLLVWLDGHWGPRPTETTAGLPPFTTHSGFLSDTRPAERFSSSLNLGIHDHDESVMLSKWNISAGIFHTSSLP